MDIDKQIERAKEAVELSKKREEIGKEMKIVYNEKISAISCYGDFINSLDDKDLEKITNLTYNLLSEKYDTISKEITQLLIPKQEQ